MPAPLAAHVGLRYDLRAAPFGRPHRDLYAAMLEQVRWADAQGLGGVTFSEHHTSPDGYLPSPLAAAAVAAGATSTLHFSIGALLLPLYDVVRLAEDMAVLDIATGGRISLIVGAGYRPEEFALFDRPFKSRFRYIEEAVAFLRAAWKSEPFEYQGRTVHITPAPLTPGGPMIFMGGASEGAARRAARIADGFMPSNASLTQYYLDECERLGKAPGLAGAPTGPNFVHVAEDPERAWAHIGPHALHETNSYGSWMAAAGDTVSPYRMMDSVDEVRASGLYAVVTPDEAVALARQHFALVLHPLMGGMDPDVAAESLALVESKVLPQLRIGG